MPKLVNQTPSLCRDRRQAYVRIEGQRIQLGRWGSDAAREAYDRIVAEWLAAGRQMPQALGGPASNAVTAIAVAYWKHALKRYDPRDLAHIKPALKLVRRLYGSEMADAFGPRRLRVVREQMVGQKLARRTINKRINWIRSAFKWAASHELCSDAIYRRLSTVPGLRRGEGGRETSRIVPVPRSSIRRLRRQLSRQVRALMDLQLLTGARAGELLDLCAAVIDQRDSVWTYAPQDHKNAHRDQDRLIYFGPRAQRILRLFMTPDRGAMSPLFSPREAFAEQRRRNAHGARRPDQKPNPVKTDRVITSTYSTASYRRAIHRACRKIGIDGWGPHRLRHNAATAVRRRFGLDVASAVLGHASLAITGVYAERNEQRARGAIAQMG